MRIWPLFALSALCLTPLLGEEECCGPPSRVDNLPLENLEVDDDVYLTGYLQALIDMHYFEFQVKVEVRQRIAYIYNLPLNGMTAESILCFIRDVPCINGVECVTDCQTEYSCDYPDPCCQISGIWFPQMTVLFSPLIADPRQVTNSAALRFNDTVIGKHVGAVTFGDEFPFFRWFDVGYFHGDLQFDIEAGIFAVFDLDNTDACLVNTDFYVAAMFSYAFDRWSFRFRLWHLSSHLGDEFMVCNPHVTRVNPSNEGVDAFASYQLTSGIRLYAGIGDIFDTDKTFEEKPLYFQWGTEIRVFGQPDCFNRLYVQPLLAMNFTAWGQHGYSVDQTYDLGVEWGKIQGVGRKARIFLEYHHGFCWEGQFIDLSSSYFAIRAMYGF